MDDPVNLLDPTGRSAESDAWNKQSARAQKAFDFWNNLLNLRMGDNQPLSDECKKNLMKMIRAISWVESQHGTGAGNNQPGRDPMQSGNPNDQWWQTLTGQDGKGDRIVGGPGKGNWWASDLPGVIGQQLPKNGHGDPNFTPDMSYLWGILLFIQKTNTQRGLGAGARTYKCGDCSLDRLLDGAVAYNGGGDPKYRQKLQDALKAIG